MLFNSKKFLLILFILGLIGCGEPQTYNSDSVINTSHLDFLYEDIEIDGKEMGIIHIYSNYPEYEWIGDDDEGIVCVDDAARAAVFYLKYNQYTGSAESLRKAKRILEFLVYMQAENGFFYNFIWDDYSINKDFKTSVAEPNWWSWRALWALMEGYNFSKDNDKIFSKKLFSSIEKIINAVKKNIPENYLTKEINGFTKPTWLPFETASDQAAILLLGLASYYTEKNDKIIFDYCNKLAEGIMLMQEGDSTSFPYGAFLSWENLWHGWGNLQAYSLLKFYEITYNEPLKLAALKEIDNFYSYLIDQNYLMEFTVEKTGEKINSAEVKKFSQIAYIIRPMIYSCMKASEITNDSSYASKSVEISEWFFGKNPANEQIYFPETGRCYDGINNENELNKNSGAESTIEALLALFEVENNSVAQELYNKKMEIYLEDAENK